MEEGCECELGKLSISSGGRHACLTSVTKPRAVACWPQAAADLRRRGTEHYRLSPWLGPAAGCLAGHTADTGSQHGTAEAPPRHHQSHSGDTRRDRARARGRRLREAPPPSPPWRHCEAVRHCSAAGEHVVKAASLHTTFPFARQLYVAIKVPQPCPGCDQGGLGVVRRSPGRGAAPP